MYIRKVFIENIRSITNFQIDFGENPAGWHVLIGDNGSGKSTVLKAISLCLNNFIDLPALREDLSSWVKNGEADGVVILLFKPTPDAPPAYLDDYQLTGDYQQLSDNINTRYDWHKAPIKQLYFGGNTRKTPKIKPDLNKPELFGDDTPTENKFKTVASPGGIFSYSMEHDRIFRGEKVEQIVLDIRYMIGVYESFSAGYGPFRRFTGGNAEKEQIYKVNPRLGAHLSLFGEDVALSEAIPFITGMYIKKLEGKSEGKYFLSFIDFINKSGLLPHGTQIDKVDSEGVVFKDGNGLEIDIFQMSDGYRSVLSLTFDLIRQLTRFYGTETVFRDLEKNNYTILLPGVVLIDEVDAHLHPTWQTRIGFWFTKFFPQIQFIVTTHSPLICRASEQGSIWRLAAPGSGQPSGEITGTDKDKLIFGNILDAYGTEVFGQQVARSESSQHKMERLATLSVKSSFGKLNQEEKKELKYLRKILTTDDETQF
ncbi:MAG: AAA family ATPase [Verrucomicrobia bacterium]|nr:AAA family ATPase [Cytophagales bacterium]